MSGAATSFGPFQRLTILTSSAVVTVTGHNLLVSFSFHEQQAGHCGFPPLSAVQCVNEVETFGKDSAASGTNREGFFDLTEPDASSEDSSGNIATLRRARVRSMLMSATWSQPVVHLTSLLPQRQTLTEATARSAQVSPCLTPRLQTHFRCRLLNHLWNLRWSKRQWKI